MDMCVCENQNKTENSETEKSSNNPLPQNTTDTHIVPPLSDVLLLEICNDVWVWCGGIAHVSARTIYQNQLQKTKSKKCKCKQYNIVAVWMTDDNDDDDTRQAAGRWCMSLSTWVMIKKLEANFFSRWKPARTALERSLRNNK